jgi:hypothetical protein
VNVGRDMEHYGPKSGYAELRRLLAAGFELQSYQVTGDPMSATATLANGAVTRDLLSDEQEFIDYCLSTHKTCDADGRTVLRRFRDANRYWTEQEELCRAFATEILGVQVRVERVELNDADEIVAVCRRGRERQMIPILDLPLPSPRPVGWEWIEAYRHWARGGR